jgi:hypothetical protein
MSNHTHNEINIKWSTRSWLILDHIFLFLEPSLSPWAMYVKSANMIMFPSHSILSSTSLDLANALIFTSFTWALPPWLLAWHWSHQCQASFFVHRCSFSFVPPSPGVSYLPAIIWHLLIDYQPFKCLLQVKSWSLTLQVLLSWLVPSWPTCMASYAWGRWGLINIDHHWFLSMLVSNQCPLVGLPHLKPWNNPMLCMPSSIRENQ